MFEEIYNYIFPTFSANFSGFTLLIILALLGLVIGFIASIFGVGGGFLLVPLMNILLGIPMELAAGSATCYIIGTSSTSFIKQLKKGNVEFHVFIIIALGSSIGAILGDVIQNFIIVVSGDKEIYEKITLIVFLAVLLLIAALMYFSPERKEGKKLPLQRFPIGPRINLTKSGINGLSISGLVLVGLSGGILTGLLGISGGVLFTPLLIIGVGLSGSVATGTSLGIVLVASLSAIIKKGLSGSGKISVGIALSLLFASVIGIQAGIKVGDKLHSARLKKQFSLIVLLAAALVIYKLVI